MSKVWKRSERVLGRNRKKKESTVKELIDE